MKRTVITRLGGVIAALFVGACTVLPSGPSVMALPGSGRSIENFREDDGYCRQFAHQQIGGQSADEAAQKSVVTSAVVGTTIGAVAGAALGGRNGAAVGAGGGLLIGSMAGSDAARGSRVGTQRHYDNAYVQCMYAKGHKVPVPANMSQRAIRAEDAGLPPPPPGLPPPPPPGAK